MFAKIYEITRFNVDTATLNSIENFCLSLWERLSFSIKHEKDSTIAIVHWEKLTPDICLFYFLSDSILVKKQLIHVLSI